MTRTAAALQTVSCPGYVQVTDDDPDTRDTDMLHHRCVYEPAALDAAVALSSRYIADRQLPDKVGPIQSCPAFFCLVGSECLLAPLRSTSTFSSPSTLCLIDPLWSTIDFLHAQPCRWLKPTAGVFSHAQ